MKAGKNKSTSASDLKGATVRFFIAYAATLVTGILSIYNPLQYESDPLLQPEAFAPIPIVSLVAVVIMALVSRTWSLRVINVVLVVGLSLVTLTVVALIFGAVLRPGPARLFIAVALYAGTLAVPCVAVLSAALDKGKRS